jgi:flagellum-specific ATP synthase
MTDPKRWDLAGWRPVRWAGRIQRMTDAVVVSDGPPCAVGDVLRVVAPGQPDGWALVIGLEDNRVRSMLLTPASGIAPNAVLRPAQGGGLRVPVGEGFLGRVVDAFGKPIDERGGIEAVEMVPLSQPPPAPLKRQPLTEPFHTGIVAIDGLTPLAQGQRIGLFAGSGVGKSVLLGMIARRHSATRTVVCLVGERGREVSEFIHENLGPEGLARSVVVVATSDQPAPARILAAEYATRIAQWFRDRGEDVLLIMDSVTRYAMALREVGLAAGELPVARGYPPSVFSALPRLLERAGASERGTMTAVYTVLVEGDDMQEPIADAVRGTLDGHVVLSRALAELGHYPAIDPTMSISRLAHRVATPAAQTVSRRFITLWSAYQQHQDLIRLGAYVPGTDPLLDEAVRYHVRMAQALQQRPDEPPVLDAVARLDRAMAEEGEESLHAAV